MGTRGVGSGGTRTLGEIFIDLFLVQFFLVVIGSIHLSHHTLIVHTTRSFSYRDVAGLLRYKRSALEPPGESAPPRAPTGEQRAVPCVFSLS